MDEREAIRILRQRRLHACGHPVVVCRGVDADECHQLELIVHNESHFAFHAPGRDLVCLTDPPCTEGARSPTDIRVLDYRHLREELAKTAATESPRASRAPSHVAVDVPQATVRTKLLCKGMCCPKEETLISNTLLTIPGVHSVTSSAVLASAVIHHDPTLVPAADLVAKLARVGIEATIASLHTLPPASHTRFRALRTCLGNSPPWWIIAAAVLTAVSYLSYLPGGRADVLKYIAIVGVVLPLPVVGRRAWRTVRARIFGVELLMLLAVVGALALREFPEAALVLTLFALAEWLQAGALDRSRRALYAAQSGRVEEVELVEPGGTVPVEEVRVDDVVAVRAGQLVPVDGRVTSGMAHVDESAITGESIPVTKTVGEEVFGGTMSVGSYFELRVTRRAEDSTVARIMELIDDSVQNKGKTELFIEKFAKIYTPVVVLAAFLIGLVGSLVNRSDVAHWVEIALTFLIAACPCAVVLSTPIVTVGALGAASRSGILIRGGRAFETLAKIAVVACDKTGTLTEGTFKVVRVVSLRKGYEDELVRTASALECLSEHPLARAVVEEAMRRRLRVDKAIGGFETHVGLGVSANIGGQPVYVGSRAFLGSASIVPNDSLLESCHEMSSAGETVVWVAVGPTVLGFMTLSDAIRESSPEGIEALHRRGIDCHIVSGDSRMTANAVARVVGIPLANVHAEQKPGDKVRTLTMLLENIRQTSRRRVYERTKLGMIGDGVNDGPALARADVGIAMGINGSHVATSTADVVLLSEDFLKVAQAIVLARLATRKVVENVAFSMALKVVVLGLTVVGLGEIWMAILADLISALVVIANGMSILWMSNLRFQREAKRARLNEDNACVASEYEERRQARELIFDRVQPAAVAREENANVESLSAAVDAVCDSSTGNGSSEIAPEGALQSCVKRASSCCDEKTLCRGESPLSVPTPVTRNCCSSTNPKSGAKCSPGQEKAFCKSASQPAILSTDVTSSKCASSCSSKTQGTVLIGPGTTQAPKADDRTRNEDGNGGANCCASTTGCTIADTPNQGPATTSITNTLDDSSVSTVMREELLSSTSGPPESSGGENRGDCASGSCSAKTPSSSEQLVPLEAREIADRTCGCLLPADGHRARIETSSPESSEDVTSCEAGRMLGKQCVGGGEPGCCQPRKTLTSERPSPGENEESSSGRL